VVGGFGRVSVVVVLLTGLAYKGDVTAYTLERSQDRLIR